MVEGTFKSVDPLAYYVNNVEDLDEAIVTAYKKKENDTLAKLTARGRNGQEYDIFICVSKNWHGFVLCAPACINPPFQDMITDVIKSPFDIPDLMLCYVFELCYDNPEMRTYKIRKGFSLFKDVKERVHRGYFIGHFEQISPSGFQVAALRAAPHRYAVLFDDCIGFAKEFCVQALAFCSNSQKIENEVNKNIKKALASGFSAEHLSRKVKSSGWFGNLALGGTDIGSMFSRRNPNATLCLLVAFFLVYPIIVFAIGSLLLQ